VQPIMKAMLILTGAATLFVIGYYIYDFMNQFK
jgi:hypothetical protein